MALGTFTLRIDGNRIGNGSEDSAQLTVKIQNASAINDATGDVFYFPPPPKMGVALPYTIALPTDVSSGESTVIGYDVLVTTNNGGAVHALFAAQPSGTTVNLTDLNTVAVPPPVGGFTSAVDSVNGEVGTVVLDAPAIPVDVGLGLGPDVQAALGELDDRIAALEAGDVTLL